MLGANATADLAPFFGEVTSDMLGTLTQAKKLPVIGKMISPFLPDDKKEEEGKEGKEDKKGSITDDITDAITDVINRVAPRTLPTKPQEYVDPRSKVPGIILSEKPLGDGRIQYTSFDIMRAAKLLTPSSNIIDAAKGFFTDEKKEAPKKEETPDPSQASTNTDVVKAIDNLANVVTKNTNSTIMLNTTLTNTKAVAANDTNSMALFV